VGPPPPRPGLGFLLRSQGMGAAHGQAFDLHAATRAIPVPGTYDLAPNAQEGAFSATYSLARGSVTEVYASRDGELELLEVTRTSVTGSFAFTAIHTASCTSSRAGAVRCEAFAGSGDSSVLTISGSFHAVRAPQGGRW
jgi:hypothetical protein